MLTTTEPLTDELVVLRARLHQLLLAWDLLKDCTADAREGVMSCRDDLNTLLMQHDAAQGRLPQSAITRTD